MDSSLVQGIIRQVADHEEEAELPLMKNGLEWQAACHEVDECMGCGGIKLQEVTESYSMMAVKDVYLPTIQKKARGPREKNRKCIDTMESDCCSNVSSMSASNSRRQYSSLCFFVSNYSAKKMRKAS